jgi:hypothetical protein
LLKLKPFEAYVGDDPVVSYVGLRADEERVGYISTKENIRAVFPFERVIQSPDLTPSGARFEGCGKGHDLFPGCPMNESADTATEKPGRALQKRPFAASGTR